MASTPASLLIGILLCISLCANALTVGSRALARPSFPLNSIHGSGRNYVDALQSLSPQLHCTTAPSVSAVPSGVATLPARLLSGPVRTARTLWSFTRPHTIIGSALSLLSVFCFATPVASWGTPVFHAALVEAAVPALLANVYITGVNQLCDLNIDKVNKPHLPLASGALAYRDGVLVVLACLLSSLRMVATAAVPLKCTVHSSLLLGSLYSLPPFRLKRWPLLAAACILLVRGSLVNIGFFLQARTAVLGEAVGSTPAALWASACASPQVLFVAAWFALFGFVIAVMKDVPDVQGDRLFSINSYSVRLGPARAFALSWRMLQALLGIASAVSVGATWMGRASLLPQQLVSRAGLGLIFAALAVDVQCRARGVDATLKDSVWGYYMHLWKVFYACYAAMFFWR